MEICFATIMEDVRYERSLTSLLSLTDPEILKQSKFIDHEIYILKKFALEELYRVRILKEYSALHLLE